MAKIIYKEGCEGQNKLPSIEGIEIDLLNGQKALIYPKYAEKPMLSLEQARKWNAQEVTEIEALKVTDNVFHTFSLREIGSPAAEFVHQFESDTLGAFCLPSLLAAMELQHQKEDIDALAETIEGADLLRDFTSYVWSCSRSYAYYGWYSNGGIGYAYGYNLNSSCLVVPLVLYR